MIFFTVFHNSCIENLLLRLIFFTFPIKLKAPLRQMSDFTLSPPVLAAILCNAPPPSPQPLLIIIAQSLRQWIPYSRFWILDSLSVEPGFWIPIVNEIIRFRIPQDEKFPEFWDSNYLRDCAIIIWRGGGGIT